MEDETTPKPQSEERKDAALAKAIVFIGSFEHHEEHGQRALEVLDDINRLLDGETF
jgi:hypothetical protein